MGATSTGAVETAVPTIRGRFAVRTRMSMPTSMALIAASGSDIAIVSMPAATTTCAVTARRFVRVLTSDAMRASRCEERAIVIVAADNRAGGRAARTIARRCAA